MTSEFDPVPVSRFWKLEAREAFRVAEHLAEKADYSYALFFGHLAIEKALKALCVIRRGEHAPPIHNLARLAHLAGIEPDKKRSEALARITAFHLEARYPDMKGEFRRRCTPEYTKGEMQTIEEMLHWLESLLP